MTKPRASLAVRRNTNGGGLSAILTFPGGHTLDLGLYALADGFAITGLDTVNDGGEITLSCRLVIEDLDVDIDTLRAKLVDAAGEDVSLDDLAAVLPKAGGQ